jgi:hypothetical protein
MAPNYVAPKFSLDGFNCPSCHAYAHQHWYYYLAAWQQAPTANMPITMGSGFSIALDGGFTISVCERCKAVAFWRHGSLLHPDTSPAPDPSPDMPPDVSEDYEEARRVLLRSPRASAALLRLALEKLCDYVGAIGKDLDAKIGFLVSGGLSSRVQQALDIVRVTGNESVHPGQMDLRDDSETARALFDLVNLIVENQVSEPRQTDELYALLPKDKRDHIAPQRRTRCDVVPISFESRSARVLDARRPRPILGLQL